MSLAIEGLPKRRPNGVQALENLPSSIGAPMFGPPGSDGAGKSSLTRAVATAQEPDNGSILPDGIGTAREQRMVRPLRRAVGGTWTAAASFRRMGACAGLLLALALPAARSAPAASRSCAGGGPHITARAEAERYIRASEDAWAASVATGDASVVKRILADDVVWVFGGRVLDKATAIAEAAEGPGPFLSNATDYVHVRFLGADVAVAQGSETWTKTGHRRGRFVWTDTWFVRGGCWQIVHAQDTVVPLAPDPATAAPTPPTPR